MLLAGIYRFENNKPVVTILTRLPSEEIAMIHDRMPVILPQEALADWLNPHYSGSEILSAALTTCLSTPAKGNLYRQPFPG